MTAMRLIDADKFILALMDAALSSVDEDTILDLVDSVPTVDAVPVVRCKDCASTRKKDDYESVYLCDDVLICTSCEASEDGWLPVWPQHFCSDGRPREEHDAETEE